MAARARQVVLRTDHRGGLVSIDLGPALARPFTGIETIDLRDIGPVVRGKVRDVVYLGDRLALIATDRLSAFDRVLGTVPYRGQVLNQLSAWWFERIADLVPTHMVEVPDPNVMIARKCLPLPVEVVVRSRLTGTTGTSAWTLYAAGARHVYGIRFPDGMEKNDPLPRPIITPTTKGAMGAHDRPITERDIVESGLVEARCWDEVRSIALAVFERGQETAAEAGLVLVDTKYEFGLDREGRVVIIDEVHTPDSSRFWRVATVEERLAAGKEPREPRQGTRASRLCRSGFHRRRRPATSRNRTGGQRRPGLSGGVRGAHPPPTCSGLLPGRPTSRYRDLPVRSFIMVAQDPPGGRWSVCETASMASRARQVVLQTDHLTARKRRAEERRA